MFLYLGEDNDNEVKKLFFSFKINRIINKKAQLQNIFETLGGIIFALVAVSIILIVGFLNFKNTILRLRPSTDYNCTNDGIVIANILGVVNITNITYSYKDPDISFNATVDIKNAQSDVPIWFGIMVIATIGVALIGLVQLFRKR